MDQHLHWLNPGVPQFVHAPQDCGYQRFTPVEQRCTIAPYFRLTGGSILPRC